MPDPDTSKSKVLAKKGKQRYNDLVYDIFLWIFTVVTDLFFREIHPRSTWRIPKKEPVIFVAAPHANQFLDPLLLMRAVRKDAHRRISFLIAAKSMKRKFIGFGAGLVGAVPVGRALDLKKPAKGKIYLPDPEGNPTLIRGNGVDFTDSKVFMKGGLLVLPSVNNEAANSEIEEILGPNEIKLKKPFKGEVAQKQLTGKDIGQGNGHLPAGSASEKTGREFEGTSFQVAPHIDQSKVYEAVSEKIKEGGCIGIFPEGGSHDRTELLPLKAGLAIMALEALKDDPNCGVTIVPVGMNYFHPHKFRSRAVIEFGTPIAIDPALVQQYKDGDRRGATGEVIRTVHIALTSVTTLAPDYETLMLIQAVRRLYNPKGKRLPLPMVVELNRRLMKGYTTYKDDPRIIRLREEVLDYNRTLFRINLRDHQVAYARFSKPIVILTFIYRFLKLVSLTLVVLPGFLMFLPVFVAGKIISRRKAKEALAASTVKVKAKDVVATWKVLVALALCPVLDFIYALIGVWWTRKNRVQGIVPEWAPLWLVFTAGLVAFPTMCFGALRFGEVGMDIWKSLRPLWLCISPSSENTIQRLRVRRQKLQEDINNIVNELGPELFPDFDKRRIVPDEDGRPLSPSAKRERPQTPSHRTMNEGEGIFSSPGSPTLKRSNTGAENLPRNESFNNIHSVGIFASRPGSPNHSRSRTNSGSGGSRTGGFASGFGFSEIETADNKSHMDEVSKTLRAEMRERGRNRRKSEAEGSEGGWEGVSATESTDGGVLTPSTSDFEAEETRKDV